MNKIYIVEGIHDEELLKRINPNIMVITTNGLAYSDELIEKIVNLEKNNEIVLILDPDYPGNKIRDEISSRLKNPKHIFIPKHLAISKEKNKVGLEHVDILELKHILENELTFNNKISKEINLHILQQLGLTGSNNSSKLRDKIITHYHLPKCNAKRLVKYLNGLNITKEELKEVLDES